MAKKKIKSVGRLEVVKEEKSLEKEKKVKIEKVSHFKANFPWTKVNYIIIIIGIIDIIFGFWALSTPPLEGFISYILAPVLLVLGFLIIIPLGIIWNENIWKVFKQILTGKKEQL